MTTYFTWFFDAVLEIINSYFIQPVEVYSQRSVDFVFFSNTIFRIQGCPSSIRCLQSSIFKLFEQFCSWRTNFLHRIQTVINNTVTTIQKPSTDDKPFNLSDLYFSLHSHLHLSIVEDLELQCGKMPIRTIINFMHFIILIPVVM